MINMNPLMYTVLHGMPFAMSACYYICRHPFKGLATTTRLCEPHPYPPTEEAACRSICIAGPPLDSCSLHPHDVIPPLICVPDVVLSGLFRCSTQMLCHMLSVYPTSQYAKLLKTVYALFFLVCGRLDGRHA